MSWHLAYLKCPENKNREKFEQLSTRNKEVLSHMTCCTKAEDISEILGISVNTVNTHKKKIKDLLVLEGNCEVVWAGLRSAQVLKSVNTPFELYVAFRACENIT
ncbi:hypothetical protein GCM10009119_11030 [Algoriphagus jejuensis]|uniref:HTH luxR-type domain-containing protein n=1 Tax=Algoriphagus jejuensis TaxID=419934 RepID=A0ABN1MXD5_9BACT